jgi:hypothetical protein
MKTMTQKVKYAKKPVKIPQSAKLLTNLLKLHFEPNFAKIITHRKKNNHKKPAKRRRRSVKKSKDLKRTTKRTFAVT